MSYLPAIVEKIDKVELLRFYRIADFGEKNSEGLAELTAAVAKKKGWFKKVEIKLDKTDKKGNPMRKTVNEPDQEMGAKRLLRDFLNNRLSYYSIME